MSRDDEILTDPDAVPQRNAADPRDVKRARRRDTQRTRDEDARMRQLLRDAASREVLLELLTFCRVFESIWTEGNRIHFNAGQQDVGHYLMARIERADPTALFAMMTEAKRRQVAEAQEHVAARARAATEETSDA